MQRKSNLFILLIIYLIILTQSNIKAEDWKSPFGGIEGNEYESFYINFTFKTNPSIISTYLDFVNDESSQPYLKKMTSEFTVCNGGEIEIYFNNLYIRGISQAAKYKFQNYSDSKYTISDISIGWIVPGPNRRSSHGIIALGLRNIQVERNYYEIFDYKNTNIKYQEATIGIKIKTNPDEQGLILNGEIDFSLRGFPEMFSSGENMKNVGLGFIFDCGYRLRAIPLSIMLGLDLFLYQIHYKEYERPGIHLADYIKKAKFDSNIGLNLKLSYAFKLW